MEGELRRSRQRVIQAQIELVVALASRRGRYEVLVRHVPIRRGVKRGNGSSHGIDLRRGHLIVRVRLSGKGIDGDQAALGEVACALGQRGNVGDLSDAGIVARALVIDEEKGAVPDQRAAERTPELVALILRRGRLRRREIIAGVEQGVAEELVGGSMELVAAGAQHNADLAAAVASERGIIGAGQDLEFSDGVDGRAYGRSVELGIAVIDAVEEEVVGILSRAVDVNGE